MAFELHGNGDNHGFLLGNFEEVHVEDGVFHGVVLHLAEHCHFLLAVVFEFHREDVGGIDELAHAVVGNGEVGGDHTAAVLDFNEFLTGLESAGEGEFDDFAAVEHCGDFALFAESLGCLLTEICTGFGAELESFHFK